MNMKVRWIREGRKIWEELGVRKNRIEIYSMKNFKLIKDKKAFFDEGSELHFYVHRRISIKMHFDIILV